MTISGFGRTRRKLCKERRSWGHLNPLIRLNLTKEETRRRTCLLTCCQRRYITLRMMDSCQTVWPSFQWRSNYQLTGNTRNRNSEEHQERRCHQQTIECGKSHRKIPVSSINKLPGKKQKREKQKNKVYKWGQMHLSGVKTVWILNVTN